jgi:(p)ppGpp synthase/HD superfamily hydrolase
MPDTTPPLLTERFDAALSYASRIHRTQLRKGAAIPYISHLLGVAAIAIENGADEDQAIAALLHDAVEDQGGLARLEDIRARFGEGVAQIVADCTDDLDGTKAQANTPEEKTAEWRARKQAYIAGLSNKASRSLAVSMADKTHNAAAINADLREHGAAVWGRFTGKRDGTLWYYRSLGDAFARHLPGAASARFAREVAEMEELALRF